MARDVPIHGPRQGIVKSLIVGIVRKPCLISTPNTVKLMLLGSFRIAESKRTVDYPWASLIKVIAEICEFMAKTQLKNAEPLLVSSPISDL